MKRSICLIGLLTALLVQNSNGSVGILVAVYSKVTEERKSESFEDAYLQSCLILIPTKDMKKAINYLQTSHFEVYYYSHGFICYDSLRYIQLYPKNVSSYFSPEDSVIDFSFDEKCSIKHKGPEDTIRYMFRYNGDSNNMYVIKFYKIRYTLGKDLIQLKSCDDMSLERKRLRILNPKLIPCPAFYSYINGLELKYINTLPPARSDTN